LRPGNLKLGTGPGSTKICGCGKNRTHPEFVKKSQYMFETPVLYWLELSIPVAEMIDG
jgi:hypothetical protein